MPSTTKFGLVVTHGAALASRTTPKPIPSAATLRRNRMWNQCNRGLVAISPCDVVTRGTRSRFPEQWISVADDVERSCLGECVAILRLPDAGDRGARDRGGHARRLSPARPARAPPGRSA